MVGERQANEKWTSLPLYILLLVIHFSALVILFIRRTFRSLRRLVVGYYNVIGKNTHAKMPKHIALIFDTKTPSKFSTKIDNIVKACLSIDDIEQITLFTQTPYKGDCNDHKLNKYSATDVSVAFEKMINSKEPIESETTTFSTPIDLAVIFSDTPQLCGFFPWKLDLTTLHFAPGPSRASLYDLDDALYEFGSVVQRVGK